MIYDIYMFARQKIREFIAYLYDAISSYNPEQRRVVLFTQGRTGSTLLGDLLSSSSYFQTRGELFHQGIRKIEPFFPIKYIEGLAKWKRNEHYLFHVKVHQLTIQRKRPIDPANFLQTLQANGWQIIYLHRRNRVKHALSNFIAAERGQWHKKTDEHEEFRLDIDCDEFAALVQRRIENEEAELEALEGLNFHEVIYEDDLEQSEWHQETVNKIFDFLSLEPRNVTTDHKKINKAPLDETIINYDEFVQCLERHGWNHFID